MSSSYSETLEDSQIWVPNFDFSKHPVISQGLMDDNPLRIFIGPFGSAKTTACCVEILRRAMEQEPAADNIRYSKWAVVRNTYSMLESTTLMTWQNIFPQEHCGQIIHSSPIRHHIQWASEGGEPGLDLLVEFMALDRPNDEAKLRSYEGTGMYFNELSEISKNIVDTAEKRVGRYPSLQQRGVRPTWFGIIADTNPPDDDHWIYNIYDSKPVGRVCFKQPPGVFECEELEDGTFKSIDVRNPEISTNDPNRKAIAGDGTKWIANPEAENLEFLPVNMKLSPDGDPIGQGGYYLSSVPNKNKDWITCLLGGDFGNLVSGKPVIKDFNERTMKVDELPVIVAPGEGGMDIGGGTLNSAAVIGQYHPSGIYLVHDEIFEPDIGLEEFCQMLKARLTERFPGMELAPLFGDPAGEQQDGILKQKYFDYIKAEGIMVRPAPTNDPEVRVECIRAPMRRLIMGERPGILIHRRCKKLIKGLKGGWNYDRVQITGTARYKDKPSKNEFSHVCEALGYWLCGRGEAKALESSRYNKPGRRKLKAYRTRKGIGDYA